MPVRSGGATGGAGLATLESWLGVVGSLGRWWALLGGFESRLAGRLVGAHVVAASVQVPWSRVRPSASRRRRFSAAVRLCSQALFLSTPR